MRRKNKEVAVDFSHIDGHVRHGLTAVEQYGDVARMGLVNDFSNGIYCAEGIRDVHDANKFGLIRKERGIGFHIEIARIEHRHDFKNRARFFSSNLPWHNIRVVLHMGNQNLIASGELSFHKTMRD